MLYILPPPSSPAPPSPWTTILCNGGSNGAAENSGESNRGSNTSLAALSSSSSTSSLSSSTSSSSLPRCTTRGNACKVWLNAIQTKNQPAKRSSHKVKLRPKRRRSFKIVPPSYCPFHRKRNAANGPENEQRTALWLVEGLREQTGGELRAKRINMMKIAQRKRV
ncbi:unnamed protein product [Bemisia tabaci]|uniref:Uncharacterized protein n=1 Tax=Bemisia tabaci TaxID=7038 RepID=A0A9P0A199_BEMTA|nr:unnamed protein product [Bemisia tabaci]